MLCPTLLVVLLLAGTVRPWVVIALSLVVGLLGVRHALFVNGALTVVAIIVVSREWLRSPLPTP